MAGVSEAFTAVVSLPLTEGVSEAFAAVVSLPLTGGVSEAFAAVVSGILTAGAVFSSMTVFLFPGSVSLGPRGGGTVAGTGVIPITLTITLAIIPTIEIALMAS
jgi:hypothetical protein